MKRNITGTSLVIAFFAALTVSSAPSAQAQECSLAGVAGKWGLTLTGTIILPTGSVPGAAVIEGTVDTAGNIVAATEARNIGGGFANETLTGSWTVNPNCTGTLTVKAYESGVLVRTSVVAIVFDLNETEVRMVQESLTLPDGTTLPVVITLHGRKMFPSNEQ